MSVAQEVHQYLDHAAGVGESRGAGGAAVGLYSNASVVGRRCLDEKLDGFMDQRAKFHGTQLGGAGSYRGHQVIEPNLKQMRSPEDRIDPREIRVIGSPVHTEQLRTAANDRQRT